MSLRDTGESQFGFSNEFDVRPLATTTRLPETKASIRTGVLVGEEWRHERLSDDTYGAVDRTVRVLEDRP